MKRRGKKSKKLKSSSKNIEEEPSHTYSVSTQLTSVIFDSMGSFCFLIAKL